MFAVLPSREADTIADMTEPETSMRPTAFLLFSALGMVLLTDAAAQEKARQNTAAIRQAADHFLQTQAGALGETSIQVGRIDDRLNLPACTALQAFLPQGSRAWGKTTVGVRCTAPAPWTVYVAATVRVNGSYVAAATPLAQGQLISPSDVTMIRGDLTALPAGVVTDLSMAVGRTAAATVAVGMPLRHDAVRSQQAVRQGQVVRLVSSGPGFKVSVEGRALTNASEGQMAQAKTPSGSVVSGVARLGGVMEVTY